MNDEGVLTDALFTKFSLLLNSKTGIALKDYKKYLVVSRLGQIVGPGKSFESFEDYYHALLTETDGSWMQTFINALTTNYSFFFRDSVHFQVLEQYLSDRAKDEPYLRFWSAASSTGEEAYSMAITLANHTSFLPADRRILATDISTKVLSQAERGVYGAEAIQRHIPPRDLKAFFEPLDNEKRFRIRDSLRGNVDFRQLNLQGDYPFRRKMDVIFLRNVMIYFGPEEKAEIVAKMYERLKTGGLLIIGLSESLAGVPHRFTGFRNSVFQKRGA